MNYILHLSAFYEKLTNDSRLNPNHISLYHALFQLWNLSRFENPFVIYREQVIRFSCIGSLHTYYKCIYDLNSWDYIIYNPSHSPKNGSEVYIVCFDELQKTENNSLDAKMPQLSQSFDAIVPQVQPLFDAKTIQVNPEIFSIGCKSDTSKDAFMPQVRCKNDTSFDAKMHPSINNINLNKKTGREEKKQTQNSEIENLSFEKNNLPGLSKNEKEKRKKVAPKKEKDFIPSSLDEVLSFFLANHYPELEAKKFFFHFESNGWKVGGKSPMKNWQAAAHNWMLNVQKFEPMQKQTEEETNPTKRYDEPL